MLLVSGASSDVARTDPRDVGILVQPGGGTRVELLRTRVWGCDNAAFTGFDEDAFTDRLHQLRGIPGCRFVACPDVVGDYRRTLEQFADWAPRLRARGWPVALVAQNGLAPQYVPWDEIDALFIGGTLECAVCAYVRPVAELTRRTCPHCGKPLRDWKLSSAADLLLLHAGMRRIWRHVGRVNSRRRMRHFLYRCESFDGSGFSKFPKRIWLALTWRRELDRQPHLAEVSR